MTDLEYKEFAQKVVEEFMQDDTDEDCSQDICVNHIGEVFLLKIREAFTLLDEKEFPHNGADRLTKMALNTFNNKRNDELNNIGSLPPCDNDIVYANISLFLGIQSAIKNHSNPEYMLQDLGIENPQEIIILIKNAESTRDIDNLFDLIFEINQKLLSIVGYDRLIKLSLWGILNLSVRKMIQFCKEESYEDFLEVSKTAKEIGEKYASICEKRVTSIYYRFKALFDKDNSNKDLISEDFIPQETALASFLIYIYEVEYNDITDSLFEELVPKYALLDFFFIFYYFIYKQPQHIVKLGFTFMSDKVSYNIREAMFSTFRNIDYAALIQYEYEWWRKKTGEELSLPFPFFKGFINLKETNIVDYDLDDRNRVIKTLPHLDTEKVDENNTQHSDLSLSTQDNTLKSESSSTEISGDMIFERLKKNLRYMSGEDQNQREAGASFRNNHLTKVIRTARSLKSRYSVYGFAYILFKSKYFDWKDKDFNKDFVADIADIFNINTSLIEGKCYNISKSKAKATKILSKKGTTYLNILF